MPQAINMIAAGNAITYNTHPSAAKCAAIAVREYNQAIAKETGITDLLTTVVKPTLETFDALCKHPHVKLLCVTGGPAVVAAAWMTREAVASVFPFGGFAWGRLAHSQAEGPLAHAQHQPPVAQRLCLHHLARENPHVAQRQLADRGDQVQPRGMGRDLDRHLQGRGHQQDID